MKLSGMYAMRMVGADTIMPTILFELNKLPKVDLAEAYVLLNETQALYLARAENFGGASGYYYQQQEPIIVSMLKKYKIEWVLDFDKLKEYSEVFLIRLGFTKHTCRKLELGTEQIYDIWTHTEKEMQTNHYINTLLRSLITDDIDESFLITTTVNREGEETLSLNLPDLKSKS